MKTIAIVAGARPNFMKIAPIVRTLRKQGGDLGFAIIHTGQHYDREMNDVFFEELGIPSRTYAWEREAAPMRSRPRKSCWHLRSFARLATLLWYSSSATSTLRLPAPLWPKKQNIPVAHVEAGLRSRDMTMPEEINRIVTDSISDLLFVTEPSGVDNLLREGKPKEKVYFVGHVMVDNLLYQIDRLAEVDVSALPSSALKARHARYGVLTLHRPSTVDDPAIFRSRCLRITRHFTAPAADISGSSAHPS